MAAKPKPDEDVVDLQTFLRERATSPTASVTVALDQGARAEIEALETELEALAKDPGDVRMGQKSPLKAKAQQIEDVRARMAASEVTFTFRPLSREDQEAIREAMNGRDDADEIDLRATAVMCKSVTRADGSEFPQQVKWIYFKALRESLGAPIYKATIDEAANRASGVRGWSVPFSSAASHILSTPK